VKMSSKKKQIHDEEDEYLGQEQLIDYEEIS
jgi:hypothetical protein